jgi:flagella basal body P-ring formation protein FlgA
MLVKARMLSAGLEVQGVQFAGADVCTVEAASVRVEPERLAAEAEAYVNSFFAGSGTEVSVTLERDVAPVLVAAGQEEPALRAVVSGPGLPVGSVRVDVEITRGAVLLKRVPVSLSVRAYRTVGVALKPISPGEALTAANVAFARRDVTDVTGASLDKPQDLAGRLADHAIAPGQIVTSRLAPQADPQVAIKANQNVFLVVQTPTLRVVTLGKALGNARKGEIAHARNLNTGREVVGVAADTGVIQVELGGANDGN